MNEPMNLIDDVVKLVEQTIRESSGREVTLAPDTPLVDGGYLDSLTVLQLFSALQEELGADLDVADLTEEAFASPASIAHLVKDRR